MFRTLLEAKKAEGKSQFEKYADIRESVLKCCLQFFWL